MRNILKKVWKTAVCRGMSILLAGILVLVPTLGMTTDVDAAVQALAPEQASVSTETAEGYAANEVAAETASAETAFAETASPETEPAASEEASAEEWTAAETSVSTATETEHIVSDADATEETGVVLMFPEELQYYSNDSAIALTDEQFTAILESLPSDLSVERIGVVLNAYSLEGKVSYFWGGKSVVTGWDVRWGNPAYVVSEGSKSTGTLCTYGLDCSGYVNRVFNNAAGSNSAVLLGDGTTGQWNLSTNTAWEDAQPGDLAFFYDPAVAGSANHVGVVAGWDENGELLVAHCSIGAGVIISNAADYGFNYIRTPSAYENEDYTAAAYSYKNLGNLLSWNETEGLDEADAVLGDVAYTQEVTWSVGSVDVGVVIGHDQNGALLIAYSDGESTVVTTAEAAGFTAFRRAASMRSVSANAGGTGVVMETGE